MRNRKSLQFFPKITFFYINYIIYTFKIKRDNHQVPKIVRVPRNKAKPKKIS